MKKSSLVLAGIIGIFTVFSTAFASHGGVSDGGGGTLNPDPAQPADIAFYAQESSKAILSWLYRQEQEFIASPEEGSPYAKLFGHEKDIFQIMPSVKFELRMTAPCLDANGAPKDASIFGKEAGTLCISPFLMAPKLNRQTAERETAALMIHEISHLMGTTEDEAVQIQKDALRDFNRVDFMDVNVNIDMLWGGGISGNLAQVLLQTQFWFSGDQTRLRPDLKRDDITDLIAEISQLNSKINTPLGVLLFARSTSLKAYLPQYSKLNVVSDYICANDSRETENIRSYCANRLNKAFGSDTVLTAREIERRNFGYDMGPEFDLVSIKRPTSWDDVRDEILQVRSYFKQLHSDVQTLSGFEISLYTSN